MNILFGLLSPNNTYETLSYGPTMQSSLYFSCVQVCMRAFWKWDVRPGGGIDYTGDT